MASWWRISTAALVDERFQVTNEGSLKWKVSDQLPSWFVEDIARTRQYHVFPSSKSLVGVNELFARLNPELDHDVSIIMSLLSNEFDVSI